LDGELAKVEQLRGVSYDLKATGKHEVGVIAEEVGAVVPEVVSWEKNGKDAQGVDYSRLTALLIEAVKQQQREIRSQTTDIRNLKSELRSTRQTLAKLQAQSSAGQTKLVASK
jgi:N-acetylglutamate synthase/N-acetylornithine aminotransferase